MRYCHCNGQGKGHYQQVHIDHLDLVVHIPGRYHDGRMLMMREFFRLADFETGNIRWENSYFIKVGVVG